MGSPETCGVCGKPRGACLGDFTHATPTPPAPADDASVERVIQELGAETGIHRLYAHERMALVRAVLNTRADDASGAEAMREAFVAHMASLGTTDVVWTEELGPLGQRDGFGVMLSVEWERFAAGYRAALPARADAASERLARAEALLREAADSGMENAPKLVARILDFLEKPNG